MKNLTVLVCITIMAGVAIVHAQTDPVQVQPVSPPSNSSYYGGGGGYYGGYHASTAAEGRLNGLGNVVRSRGQANLSNSAAAINYSIARRSEIDNYRQGTEAYFDMRAANRRARAAERGPRATMEDLVRYAHAGKPKPLSPSEVDTVTGAIRWPMLLQSDDFAADRAKLEEIFVQSASSGTIGRENYMKARDTTRAMLGDLKQQVREVPPEQYVIAKKFLQSLAYAAGRRAG